MTQPSSPNKLQHTLRIILSTFMLLAGISHLTFSRVEFQAQVPDWIPLSKDLVVILSGIVEIGFGLAMIFWKKERIKVGIALAMFFILIFPGNIDQYINHTNAFGLNSDQARLMRLFFQPILIVWALWCTDALSKIFRK